MSQSEQKKEIEKLRLILDFPKAGISDTPNKESVSYETTIPKKHIVQAGLITETKIENNIKTVSTRKQTDSEKLDSLFQVLEHF